VRSLIVERLVFALATGALCFAGAWSVRILIAPPEDGSAQVVAPAIQWSVLIALSSYTLFLLLRARHLGFLPVSNMFEAVTFFLWCSMAMAIFVTSWSHMSSLPTFLLPFLAVLGLFAFALIGPSGVLKPELRTGYFLIHMLCAFLGYAAFMIAAITASMYVLQEHRLRTKQLSGISRRLPSLEGLENLTRQLLTLGFPLFTVAIALGVVLAHRHELLLGEDWNRNAKVLSAGATWVAYGLLFVGSRTSFLYGRKVAWFTLAGFVCVLFTFLGTSLLLGDTHGIS